MTTKPVTVTREHREAAAVAMRGDLDALHPFERNWVMGGPVIAGNDMMRVAQAIADAESRGARSVASAADGREAALLRIHADLCDELGVEEKDERSPILEALNRAHNTGAQGCAERFAKAGLLSEQPRQGAADGREVWVVEYPNVGPVATSTKRGDLLPNSPYTLVRYVPAELPTIDAVALTNSEQQQLAIQIAAQALRSLPNTVRRDTLAVLGREFVPAAKPVESLAGWAVRCLDADAAKHGTNVPQVQRGLRDKDGKREWTLFLTIEGGRAPFTATTPELARISAARALYAADNSLPAPPDSEGAK